MPLFHFSVAFYIKFVVLFKYHKKVDLWCFCVKYSKLIYSIIFMKQELIVKSNVLLQQPLYKTSIELKIFSMVLLKIRESPEGDVYTLNIKELMEHFEGSTENYTYLKSVAKNMFGAVDLNPSEKGFDLNVVFVRINTDQENRILFEINKNIKPYILDLTHNFTRYYFENIARLKSSFSIRIYELLKQYEKIGNRTESINYLRHFLNISEDKYIKYSHFKARVLVSSQKELKNKTDIYFEFDEIKTGRKVTEISFKIFKNVKILKENGKDDLIESSLTSEQDSLKQKLIKEYGIAEKTAFELVDNISIKQIEDNIAYSQTEFEAKKINSNFTGFLIKAIKNNYANNVSLFEESEKKKKAEAKRKQLLQERKEQLTGELSRDFSKQARLEYVESLSEEQQKALLNEILEEFKLDDFGCSQIRKSGLKSPLVYVHIINRIENFAEKKQAYIQEGLEKAGLG